MPEPMPETPATPTCACGHPRHDGGPCPVCLLHICATMKPRPTPPAPGGGGTEPSRSCNMTNCGGRCGICTPTPAPPASGVEDKHVWCSGCGDALVQDGDDNLCWVCVGTLKTVLSEKDVEVARLTRELAEARAEGWREALEAFRARIDTERWHNFPVSMREFNNAIDATLAALVARGDGRGNG
jgi:hypothetical protein